MYTVKLREVTAMLSTLDLKSSLDHLVLPLACVTEQQQGLIINSLQAWLEQIVVKEIENLCPVDLENIHKAIKDFMHSNDALSLKLRFYYAGDVVTLMLLKVTENEVPNVLLSNLWIGTENIISSIVVQSLKG